MFLEYHPLDNITLPKNTWRPNLLPSVAWNPWIDIRERDDIAALNVSFPFGPMPVQMAKKILQSYNAATSYIDDLVGQLLKLVDNNTIIIFTGDHGLKLPEHNNKLFCLIWFFTGWSYGEHGEFSKYSNFREATRVPLILHIPQLNKDTEILIKDPVELVDLFPTLVDLTHVSESLNRCEENGDNSKLCTEGKSLVSSMYYSSRNIVSKLGINVSSINIVVF